MYLSFTRDPLRALLAAAVLTIVAGATQAAEVRASAAVSAASTYPLHPATPPPSTTPPAGSDNLPKNSPATTQPPNPRLPANIPADYPYDVAGGSDSSIIDSRDMVTRRLNQSSRIEPLGENALGENINLTTGSLSFQHNDIVLKGHGPDIVISRSFDVESKRSMNYMQQEEFGDWSLDLPNISTNGRYSSAVLPDSALASTWQVAGANPNARCSNFGPPPEDDPNTLTKWWWDGVQLEVPGQGSQTLLKRDPAFTAKPSQSVAGATADFPIVTSGNWAITCLPSIRNGAAGEAFLAIAPNGDKYWFDYLDALVYGESFNIVRGAIVASTAPLEYYVWMHHPRMLVTRIEDRHGNAVDYSYADGRLEAITGSDGRRVELEWRHSRYGISQITAINVIGSGQPSRRYEYKYSAHPIPDARLTEVKLPDASSWTFNFGDFLRTCGWLDPTVEYPDYACPPFDQGPSVMLTSTGTVTAPTGLTGTFTLTQAYISRWVTYTDMPGCDPWNFFVQDPCIIFANQLKTRRYTGNGVDETWRYESNGLSTVVTDPLQDKTAYVIVNNSASAQDGQVVRAFEGATIVGYDPDNWSALRTTETTPAPTGTGPYPAKIGTAPQYFANRAKDERFNPRQLTKIVQDGVTFTNRINAYDSLARPAQITRSSTLGYSRTENLSYDDHLPTWTLGRTDVVTEQSTGLVVVDNSYDSDGNLSGSRQFGLDGKAYTYYSNGTVKTVTDADQRTVQLNNYKFGIPQQFLYDNGDSETFGISSYGEVESVTDANGFTTSYGYDAMGRQNSTTYPVQDSVAWNTTLAPFARATGTISGLGTNPWQVDAATGTGHTVTYYDARWRPVLTHEYDSASPGSNNYVVTRYDAHNRKVFQSYPLATLGNIADPQLKGITYRYDALGRTRQVLTDSELGNQPLLDQTEYLSGFRKRTTNSRALVTTTSYQAFDQPSEAFPVRIQTNDERNAFTAMKRDVFGKVTEIERGGISGGGGAKLPPISRHNIYDAHQRLCKMLDPESGASVLDYYPSGLTRWAAAGLDLPSQTSCDRNAVPNTQKSERQYDVRARLRQVNFGDNSPGITTTYYPDGQPHTVNSGGTSWTYGYNKRRLLETEILQVDGKTFGFTHAYDANGSESQLTYPDGEIVPYAPDALGLPTRAGAYATGVRYNAFRNVTGFSYGNGILHSMAENLRGMVGTSQDSGVFSQVHAYDEDGNVKQIADALDPVNTRTMEYDTLGRLTALASGLWPGGVSYAYDPFDNITSSKVGARALSYQYQASTNRLSALSPVSGGAPVYSYGYDARGNVTSRNTQAFVFDLSNRMTSAVGKESYVYDGHGRRVSVTTAGSASKRYTVYGRDGRLLHEVKPRGETANYIYLQNRLVARSDTAPAQPLDVPVLTSGYRNITNLTGTYCFIWNAIPGATSYEMQERSASSGWTSAGTVDSQSWCAEGKTSGTYEYHLRACGGGQCSAYSATESITVQLSNPLAAPLLSALPSGTNSSGNIELRWLMPGQTTPSATSDRLLFTIQEKIGSAAPSVIANLVPGWSLALPPRTSGTYNYSIRTCLQSQPSQCGAFGTAVQVIVNIPSLPGLPASLSSSENPSDDGSYRVSWPAVANASDYTVQESSNNGVTWTTVQNRNSARFWDASGKTEGSYKYQVTACNALGCNAGFRTGLTVVVDIPDPPPAAPATITAVPYVNTPGWLNVRWAAVASANRYRLEEKQPGGDWQAVRDPGTDLDYFSGLSAELSRRPQGVNKYKVQACRASLCGPFSAEASATLAGPPPVVTSITATPAVSTDGTYQVSWTAAPGAGFYLIEEQLGEGTPAVISPQLISPTLALFSQRGDGTFRYRVKSCRIIDGRNYCSDLSAAAIVRVERPNTLPPPDRAIGLARCVTPGTEFTIGWSRVDLAERYEIEETNDVDSTVRSMTVTQGLTTPLLRRGLINGHDPTTFAYKVRACRGTTCSEYRGGATACMDLGRSGGPVVATIASYQHTDTLGSVVAESNATGQITPLRRYESYGAPADASYADGVGFAGHLTDASTQLSYMQQRYYDPIAGRFLSVDPVGVDLASGGNFNRYWYANNNPHKFVDPDGRDSSMFYTLPQYSIEPPAGLTPTQAGWAAAAHFGAVLLPVAAVAAPEVATAIMSNAPAFNNFMIGVADAIAGEAVGPGSYALGSFVLSKSLQNSSNLIDHTGYRWEHILNRHEFGRGVPGKTEFPKSWSGAEILHHVSSVAIDTSLPLQPHPFGPYRIGIREGIEIRVDFFDATHRHAGQISSAYPLNTPVNP